jgi:hypothetical protein
MDLRQRRDVDPRRAGRIDRQAVNALDWIAEQRIAEAIARGDFDDLPGAGKPLALDDDPLVPADVRMACRILRNAGLVPAELAERREAMTLRAVIAAAMDGDERRRATARLALLEMRLEARRAGVTSRGWAGCP